MKKSKTADKNEITGQMLNILEACDITGLSKTCITKQIHSGKIRATQVARRLMIPGVILREYMKTADYERTKRKSACYKKNTVVEVHKDE